MNEPAMTLNRRDRIVDLLAARRDDMARRFGVSRLSLFGSAARDELRNDSDIDVLVEFSGPASFDAYFGLKDYLQDLTGRPVDLVTSRGLKPRARAEVERELVQVT